MMFPLRMAWRETRAAWPRFLFFIAAIAIGVGALTGVRGFAQSLRAAMLREAKTLLAADMQISMSRPAAGAQLDRLAELRARGVAIAHNTETLTVASLDALDPSGQSTLLVDVKAVDPALYPFYGRLELEPQADLPSLLHPGAALVAPDVLARTGLHLGDSVRLGRTSFRIAGLVRQEPDKVVSGFSLGPRVMIHRADLDGTGLIAPGSRAREIYLLRLPDGGPRVEEVRAFLQRDFARRGARVSDYLTSQTQVRRFLDRMGAFLGLVTLITLIVAGLGVASSLHAYLQQKLDTIAVLKCLGARARAVLAVYLAQTLGLGGIGSALGVGIGYLLQAALPRAAGPLLGIAVRVEPVPYVALQGLLVGLGTTLLFALVPLLATRHVKPAWILRRHVDREPVRPPGRPGAAVGPVLAAILVGVGLAGLAVWQAGSLRWGLAFVGGLLAVVAVVACLAALGLWIVRVAPKPTRVEVRHGLGNLHRPGSQATAVVLALGVGVTVVATVFLIQSNLLRQIGESAPPDAPNVVFLNIQKQQVEEYRNFIRQAPGVLTAPEPVMLVPARLTGVKGRPAGEIELPEDDRWLVQREWTLTTSATIPEGNRVVEGRWWQPADYRDRTLISVEEDVARRLRLRVDDQVEFTLAGQRVPAVVSSIRHVVWFRPGPNFLMVLSPGSLERFPLNYVSLARVEPERVPALQKAAMERFPNVTVLNLGDVLVTIRSVLERIGLVIRFIATFSILAGLAIMAGSVAATRWQRVRELALLKTLGATRRRLAAMLGIEFGALGALGGLLGAGLANLTTAALMRLVLESEFSFNPGATVGAVLGTGLLTLAAGFLSTSDVLGKKPLAILREE